MRQHITVNADGSADLEVVALVDKDTLEEEMNEAETKGFKVGPYEEGDKAGIRATKHYAEAQDVFEDMEDVDGTIEVVPGPVKTTYRVTMTVPGSGDAETAALGGSAKILLTLPGSAGENNADSTEGKTLVWDAMDGAEVQAESTAVSVWVWFAGAGVCGCGLLFAVVLLVVLLMRARKEKASAAVPQAPPYPPAPPQVYAPPAAPAEAAPPLPTSAPPAQGACPQCGNALVPGARFCNKCGAQLD